MAFGKKSKGQPISVQGLSKQIKLCIQTCYDLAGNTVLQGPGGQLVRQIKASIGATSCVRDFLIFSKQLVFISCHFSSQIQAGFPFRGGGKAYAMLFCQSYILESFFHTKSFKTGSQENLM